MFAVGYLNFRAQKGLNGCNDEEKRIDGEEERKKANTDKQLEGVLHTPGWPTKREEVIVFPCPHPVLQLKAKEGEMNICSLWNGKAVSAKNKRSF